MNKSLEKEFSNHNKEFKIRKLIQLYCFSSNEHKVYNRENIKQGVEFIVTKIERHIGIGCLVLILCLALLGSRSIVENQLEIFRMLGFNSL